MKMSRLIVAWCSAVFLLVSCAAPPLTVYTLGASSAAADAAPLAGKPVVIEVARVTVPDELDSTDIVVRDGSALVRSQHGRWANRLSVGITERLTKDLAARRRDALVTERPQPDAPSYRILINIGRLDVMASGAVTLDADWLIVPRDPAVPTRRDRGRFTTSGPVATDQDVVTLVGSVLDKLAGAIEIGRPRKK
jgi:uncharacterized lipoprotein YmbA